MAFSLTGDPPARRRRVWLPRTLNGRIVAGVVALVIVLVGLIATTTYFAFRSFTFGRLDQILKPVADANERAIYRCLTDNPMPNCAINGPGRYEPSQTEWLAVLDTSGDSVVDVQNSDKLRYLRLAPEQGAALAAHPSAARTVTTVDGAELRVTGRDVEVGNAHFVVLTGLSTDEAHRTLRQLLLLELGIGAGAVTVAVLATSWGVRRSLRNLYAVTGTAREVASELSPEGAGLDRRVPVTEDETEVGQLAESMNTMLAAVETEFHARVESERRMRQFLADASHELRTPLTSITGYAELARMRGAGQLDDDLRRIHSQGERMTRIVEDLLTLARTGQDDAPAEWHLIDVGELLDDVVAAVRGAFPEREITVEAPAGLTVIGDPDQLLRAVLNPVANAAMHTDPAGPITVRSLRDGADVVVQVVDAGPGLPPEEAAHVFERFWRADKARSRSRGGSGLGMSIVASLVQAHGGSVRFDSSVTGGSTVTVRLPAATS